MPARGPSPEALINPSDSVDTTARNHNKLEFAFRSSRATRDSLRVIEKDDTRGRV